MNERYESAYFKIHELSEGVFAAIDNGGSKNAGSNSGIIDLGGITVVVDTMMDYDAACELKKACFELTGRLPVCVVNSHSHLDHVVGNSLFKIDGARLISSPDTRKALIAMKSGIEKEKSGYEKQIWEIEESLKSEADQAKIEEISKTLAHLRNMSRPEVIIYPTDMTFEKDITIHGDKRDIVLHNMGVAHSPGDVVAYLPEEKILLSGDLLFSGNHPWMGSGRPGKLIDVLDEILKWEVECFVPGHGEISLDRDVKLLMQYIKEMIDLVKKRGSLKSEDYTLEDISPVFMDWKKGHFFKRNIEFLIGKLLNGSK